MIPKLLVVLLVAATVVPLQDRPRPATLSVADIDDITRLILLEDTRQFDEAALARILGSQHPEVRRRAAVTIGRVADPRGSALLAAVRGERDPEVAAAVVFAAGQLKDTGSVPWLAELLMAPGTPPPVAREAARSLGKIQALESRAALARYLASALATGVPGPAVGEALLAIGRFTARHDIGPITRWTKSRDPEVRWRAAWALLRPRDPAAVPHLFKLTEDASPEVRFWAARGLAPPPPAAPMAAPAEPVSDADRSQFQSRLRLLVRDVDRRVRTEALRALALYDDDASFAIVLAALDSPDTWLSVSAAEAMGRFQTRAGAVVPRLVAASGPARPTALRVTALTALVTLAPEAALGLADALARDASVVARTAGRQALGRLGATGKTRLDALASEGLAPSSPSGNRAPRRAPEPRPDAEYRRLVERWIVPEYNGALRPKAVLETPRGSIEVELYAGDAPLGLEHFIRMVESGEMVGTEFGRVVPNFVAQQRAIRDDITLRDEVNRHGLARGTLSWASAGLDTGRPGYTLGSTPQPHNEGNFTALGRVVTGMDVVDRVELGDKITAARLRK